MSDKRTLSRRRLLKKTMAAAGGAALLAQAGSAFGQAPAAVTRRRFKAWISRGDGPGRTTLQDATLRPIGGRQVRRAHRGHEPLLLERAGGARPAAAGGARGRARSRRRRALAG